MPVLLMEKQKPFQLKLTEVLPQPVAALLLHGNIVPVILLIIHFRIHTGIL